MARPGLRNNRKFRRLKAILKMPSVYVAAHLQAMWDVSYENGDPVLGDKVDVELCAEWEDSGRAPGEWFDAAKEAGFIDETSDGKYLVHDLFDHAPDYVRKRAKREEERRSKSEPSLFATKQDEPAEEEKPAVNDPVIVTFPTNGNVKSWDFTESRRAKLAIAFPGIDIAAEARKARQWAEDNPTKKKTSGGMARFIFNWMERAQNNPRGPSTGSNQRRQSYGRELEDNSGLQTIAPKPLLGVGT